MEVSELLSKKRGTRNVYIRHRQNLINEIKELINNFDPSKPKHCEKLKRLRNSLGDKMNQIKKIRRRNFWTSSSSGGWK